MFVVGTHKLIRTQFHTNTLSRVCVRVCAFGPDQVGVDLVGEHAITPGGRHKYTHTNSAGRHAALFYRGGGERPESLPKPGKASKRIQL